MARSSGQGGKHPVQTAGEQDQIGFVGWLRRVEKKGEREGVARDKDRGKEEDRKRKSEAKVIPWR